MKKIMLLFVAIITLNMAAQKEVKEGVMTMKMVMSTDNEQAKAAFAMIGDIAVTTYFKGQKSRTEQSNQNANFDYQMAQENRKYRTTNK